MLQKDNRDSLPGQLEKHEPKGADSARVWEQKPARGQRSGPEHEAWWSFVPEMADGISEGPRNVGMFLFCQNGFISHLM